MENGKILVVIIEHQICAVKWEHKKIMAKFLKNWSKSWAIQVGCVISCPGFLIMGLASVSLGVWVPGQALKSKNLYQRNITLLGAILEHILGIGLTYWCK